MTRKSVLVIGAGIGGLTAAIHLARGGLQVTVIEKNSRPGGRCDRFEREGHRFDTGPTLFVMPRLYEAEFRALGVSMHEQLDLLPVDPTYDLVFDDGSQLRLTIDNHSLREQLESMEAGSYRGLQRYLDEGEQNYGLTLTRVVNCDFRRLTDFIRPKMLATLVRMKAFTNHYRNMSHYFSEPRLKSAFTFQDMYMGLSPFHAPATYSLMPYSELAHGVWYPRRGMYSVVESLVRLAGQAGVDFSYSSSVEEIATNGHRTRGVVLTDGQRLSADVVLANADLPYVYQNLLPPDRMARALPRKHFSCSVISFFWGVDKIYDRLGPHTLFLPDDYRENFHSIIDCHDLPANPSVYIHAPARLDPDMAPPGRDTITAIVPVGHMSSDGQQDWNHLRDLARRHVFRRLATLGINDIESHIAFEQTCIPPTWRERYNLLKGSTHGLSHTWSQMACFRPANRHARYRNLYFVGASTHPGTGMPTAMVSGRLAAARILDELPELA